MPPLLKAFSEESRAGANLATVAFGGSEKWGELIGFERLQTG